MTELLDPKSSGRGHFFLHDDYPCNPRLWDFSHGSSFSYFQISCFRVEKDMSQAPKLRNVRKKRGAPLPRSMGPRLDTLAAALTMAVLVSSSPPLLDNRSKKPIDKLLVILGGVQVGASCPVGFFVTAQVQINNNLIRNEFFG